MEQKQRNRMAWIAAVVLAPILIYLLATNIFGAGKQPPPPPAAAPAAIQAPLPPSASPSPKPMAAPKVLDPKVLDEQQQIASRLPKRNPFSAVPQTAPVSRPTRAAVPTRVPETAIRLTGIVSRPGASRMAMINGKLLSEGDRIGPWTILKVDASNVLLGNGTQRKVVGVR